MKDKGIIGIEIKKHLRNNVGFMVWYAVGFIVLSIAVLAVSTIYCAPMSKNISEIKKHGYSTVIESDLCYNDFSCYYKFKNLITFRDADNSRINVNTYMVHQDTSFISYDKELLKNEVSISEKIADKLNLSIGDTVFIEFPLKENAVEYTIVNVTPYVWDYYDVENNLDFSAACIGYDESIEYMTSGKYVYFLDAEQWKTYVDNEYSYDARFNVDFEIEHMKSKIVICELITMILLTLFAVINAILVYKTIVKEATRYRMNSYNISSAKKIYRSDYIIYCIFPILLLLLVGLAICLVDGGSFIITAYTTVILLVNILGFEMGGRIFERAN